MTQRRAQTAKIALDKLFRASLEGDLRASSLGQHAFCSVSSSKSAGNRTEAVSGALRLHFPGGKEDDITVVAAPGLFSRAV